MTNYSMSGRYSQFDLPDEYTEVAVNELGSTMGITIDNLRLQRAMENDGDPLEFCVYIESARDGSRIIADCMHTGLLNSIVVLCSPQLRQKAHDVLLKRDTMARREYSQETQRKLEDRWGQPESLLISMEKVHRLKLR